MPYAHLAAALDALEATRSRLAKEAILSNAFRSILALQAPPAEIEAACYLLSPAKDAQTGGHRLRPDWEADGKPLGITGSGITAAILEASGAKKAQFSALNGRLRDAGAAALALRDSVRATPHVPLPAPRPHHAPPTLHRLGVRRAVGSSCSRHRRR